jgi:AraC-like DNA-binding protein
VFQRRCLRGVRHRSSIDAEDNMLAPSSTATIRVAICYGLDELVLAAGADYHALLRQVGIDPVLLGDVENRMPFHRYVALLEAAAVATGDDLIGMRLGAMQAIQMIGVLGYVVRASPDVRTQLIQASRYFALHQEGAALTLRGQGPQAEFVYTVFDPNVSLHRQDAENTLAIVVSAWRSTTGLQRWAPASVHFEHPAPSKAQELGRFFGCPVHFSDTFDGIRFPAESLDTPVHTADPTLYTILTRYAEESLSRHKEVTSLAAQARRLIVASLASGGATIDGVAQRMAMTPRTLQRRLEHEGLQFSELVDDIRKDLAAQYLRDTRLGLTDTAFLVGYSDLSAFHRAFRRWFKQTPLEFQKTRGAQHTGER